ADHLGFEVAADRIEAAGAELLAGDERRVRDLSLRLAVELEPVRELLRVAEVALEIDEAAGRLEALVVELEIVAAEPPRSERDAGVELRQRLLTLPGRGVGRDERIVVNRGREARVALPDLLAEMLVVRPERQRMEEAFAAGQRHDRARAEH